MYLLFNHMRFDTRNAYPLIDALMRKPNSRVVVQHSGVTAHGFKPADVRDIYTVADMLSTLRRLELAT